jgi:hypothetical protein
VGARIYSIFMLSTVWSGESWSGRIGKVGREVVEKLDYQLDNQDKTCLIITINDNDTCTCDFL